VLTKIFNREEAQNRVGEAEYWAISRNEMVSIAQELKSSHLDFHSDLAVLVSKFPRNQF
jgi:hypothetical protein